MKKIAFYGKGGIGKSTTASHVSAALALSGKKVCQIGCDPKNDSTRLLLGHICKDTVLDLVRTRQIEDISVSDIVHTGFRGISCVEAGGPEPGVGCAGRGIIVALELLEKLKAVPDADVTIYDVLGDVVCGGFAMPIREGYAKDIYIVSSGELMSLYAANNRKQSKCARRKRAFGRICGKARDAARFLYSAGSHRECGGKSENDGLGICAGCAAGRCVSRSRTKNRGRDGAFDSDAACV